MSLLFARKCVICGALLPEEKRLCTDCERLLSPVLGKTCPKCGREVPHCVCKKAPLHFVSRTAAPFYYEGMLRSGVARFKFYGGYGAADFFREQMLEALRLRMPQERFDTVTCIPAGKASRRARGFDQSRLLAEGIARALSLPFEPSLLYRVFETRSQHFLSMRERSGNVFGVFETDEVAVRGKNILLIDDVMTTGCTVGEAAAILRLRGGARVCVLVAAVRK